MSSKVIVKNRMTGSRKTKYVTRAAVVEMLKTAQENKAYAVANAVATAVSGTGTGHRISGGVIVGDNSYQRQGAQIQISRLDVKFIINGSVANLTNARLIIVQDKQANSADMALNTLLNSTDVYSQYHPVYQAEEKRYNVLLDKSFDLSYNGINARTFNISLRPLKRIQYADTTDVSTACGKNFIWAWVIGNNTSATYTLSTTQHFTDS